MDSVKLASEEAELLSKILIDFLLLILNLIKFSIFLRLIISVFPQISYFSLN